MARERPLGPYYFEALDLAVAMYMRGHNVNQAWFADELGVAENTMSAKLRGFKEFTPSELIRLCDICGLSMDEACGRAVPRDREVVA